MRKMKEVIDNMLPTTLEVKCLKWDSNLDLCNVKKKLKKKKALKHLSKNCLYFASSLLRGDNMEIKYYKILTECK